MEETRTVDISQRLFMLIGLLVVVIAISVIAQMIYQFESLPGNAPREITVTGEAKAYAKPDIAVISFGTHTEAQKSQDAVSQSNQIMETAIKAVKDLGIEEKDIRTTMYNLSPIYDYTEKGRNFRGYALDQQVQVKIRDFNKINGVLDKIAVNGINTIGDLQFTIDDMETVRAEARKEAIEKAKAKAENMLAQSGLRIKKLVNISEGYSPVNPPMPYYGIGMGGAEAKDAVVNSIQTGQLEINTMVTLTYTVR